MSKIIHTVESIWAFITGGIWFPRYDHLNRTINIEDHHVTGQRNHLLGICFTLWAKSGVPPKGLSNIELYTAPNSDNSLVDIRVASTSVNLEKHDHLATIKKNRDYDINIHLNHNHNIVIASVKIRPSTHNDESKLQFTMPCDKLGFIY